MLHFLVRLACVRHAASVDSEPGSNSHLKPVVCRRVVGRLPPLPRRGAMDLSCEIARIRTRDFHLTTGTFNLVVKDRSASPPERRVFSPGDHTEARPTVLETCFGNLCKLRVRCPGCQPIAFTGFPPVMHNEEPLTSRRRSISLVIPKGLQPRRNLSASISRTRQNASSDRLY